MSSHADVSPLAPPRANPLVAHLPTAARILMGLMFLVFGLNGFLHFLPQPSTPPPVGARNFIEALLATGYMFPLIKGIEVVAGMLLLANRYVAMALVLLAPIVVNIVAFHVVLEPAGTAIAVAVVVMELYLAWQHRETFAPLFEAGGSRTDATE